MIKTPVLCAALVAVLSFSALAEGARGIYVRADGGVTMPKTNAKHQFKSSSLGSVGVGYHFNDVFKADVNWQMRKLKVNKGGVNDNDLKRIENSGVMLNGYINLSDSEDWMIPYLTAGIGYGTNKIKGFEVVTDVVIETQAGGKIRNKMWNVGVGVAMEIMRNLRLDLAYRYTDLGKASGRFVVQGPFPHTDNTSVKSIKTNEVVLGLIYNF